MMIPMIIATIMLGGCVFSLMDAVGAIDLPTFWSIVCLSPSIIFLFLIILVLTKIINSNKEEYKEFKQSFESREAQRYCCECKLPVPDKFSECPMCGKSNFYYIRKEK